MSIMSGSKDADHGHVFGQVTWKLLLLRKTAAGPDSPAGNGVLGPAGIAGTTIGPAGVIARSVIVKRKQDGMHSGRVKDFSVPGLSGSWP